MAKQTGPENCQAAIFVYKDDDTKQAAWDELLELQKTGPVRCELHNDKDQFLSSLQAWNHEIKEPENAFLCIYAHMGDPGLCCVDVADGREVSWDELAQHLPRGGEVLWLAGCTSDKAINAWAGKAHPVHRYLVATADSKFFLPLVPIFAYEISIDPVFRFEEMPYVLSQKAEQVAAVTRYYEVKDGKFSSAFETISVFDTPDKLLQYADRGRDREFVGRYETPQGQVTADMYRKGDLLKLYWRFAPGITAETATENWRDELNRQAVQRELKPYLVETP